MRHHVRVALLGLSLVALTHLGLQAGTAHAEPAIKISGFVDSSLVYVFTPKLLADQGLFLGLDQVELDFDVAIVQGLRLRTDLNFFPHAGIDTTGGPVSVFDQIVEQGFAEYNFDGTDKGVFLRAGKWNAPVGFEVTDPTGLWQYSQGLLFTHATPTNLTGFAFGWIGETTQAQLWLTNDWDTPSTAKDTNIGGRVQQAVGDVGTIGVSATYGSFVEDPAKLMIDLDLAFTFDKLKLGGEFNYGKQGDNDSIGFLLSANYTISDLVGVTARFDYLDRKILDLPYKGMSITGAGLFTLTPGLTLVAEVRADMPDGGDTAVTGALELTAAF
ncbi:MAG: outer membrane beta-barrel protein [Myxococcota bacterium]